MKNIMIKKILLSLLIFTFCLVFLSYRLLETPQGINIDEAAFGYNASLISQTLRDENNRFLPVFVLSLQGRDWRQPVAQYFQVGIFKIFGRSFFNLRFSSVLIASISGILIFFLGSQLLGKRLGGLAIIIFLTSPIVIIHSHLGLDNIYPVPFILLWLIGIFNFNKSKSLKHLVIAGISLGIAFYAHKSMRSASSVWAVLTVFFLISQIKSWRQISWVKYKAVVFFIISVAPFYLMIPLLEYKYAGAVFGSNAVGVTSVYEFFKFYLSNFDLSFLFISGDIILHHSTGIHGMFLLASLPLFVYGMYKSLTSKNNFLIFLLYCFFLGPLLMGFVGSIHRASRLIFLTPFFCLICGYGFLKFLDLKKWFFKFSITIFCFVFALNFFEFINYYWFQYPKDTYHIFYSTDRINAYKKLYEISRTDNLRPLISTELLSTSGDSGAVEDFARSLYFVSPEPFSESSNMELPPRSVLLTEDENFIKGKKVDSGIQNYFLYIKE